MITKIATVGVYVEDQQKAKSFWTEKVGFEVVESMKAKGVEFEGELQKMQWGTFATFRDLDGNTFLLKG